ncbi:maleylpyruvate isomerase family mycothiol-dependent enzyme [Streptomyces fulvoviolaceus]|uniref:maleylpyruvate isomerase family mycothiol-dependent enzyme n=1 Tax=Streptomyces fulvoviolaceus TaxID=285535 RepID=UPI0004C9F9E3|nr:maleylpyruvate isomerase family mycothiol-dependent enzyme [Streptomyces fulvoviolaceus]MCT9077436.1 maleylpyruvate isomerase N-terminal domain-containing protein [Streptomyces fulvoviolaceus]
METLEFIQTLEQDGLLLAAAAEEAGTDAKVPTCPEWQVKDLVRHTGAVHRWAASFVAEQATSPRPFGGLPDLDGAELLAWFRTGHRHLVDTLSAARPDVQCWQFLPAPSPLAFWARRQAHETAVHRFDAEAARGGTPDELARDFAADGIDELLLGFHARSRSRVRSEVPRVLRVRATDADGAVWTVRLTQEPPAAVRNDVGDADCELAGPAARLYLSLWNRLPFPSLTGDASVAELWREKSAV